MNHRNLARCAVLLANLIALTGCCAKAPLRADHDDIDRVLERSATIVVVQDRLGDPIAGALVYVSPGYDPTFGMPLVTPEDGMARVSEFWGATRRHHPVEDEFNIVVVHKGHRSVVLRRFSGYASLRLRTARPTIVRIRLDNGTVLPEKPNRIEPILEWVDADPHWEDPRQLAPIEGTDGPRENVIEFQVDDPGKYAFGVFLWGPVGDVIPNLDPEREAVRLLDVTPSPLVIQVNAEDEVIEVDARFDARVR